MIVDDQPRENRADEDATGVSSDLQRLFEASSFGSPEAREAYSEPPPHLVAEIVNRIRRVDAIADDCNETNVGCDGERWRGAALWVLDQYHASLPSRPTEDLDVPAAARVRMAFYEPNYFHDIYGLVSDLMVLADRDATQQRHVASKPLTCPTLTGSWWLLPGCGNPREIDQRQNIDKTRFGQDAFDLAQDYLAIGKLDPAQRWLRVAAEYDIQQAEDLLDDIAAIQDALDNPSSVGTSEETPLNFGDAFAEQARRIDLLNEIHEAAGSLRRAHQRAEAIVNKAESTAEEIVSRARTETTADAESHALIVVVGRNKQKDWLDGSLHMPMPRLEFKRRAIDSWCDLKNNLARFLTGHYLEQRTATSFSDWGRSVVLLGDSGQIKPQSLPPFDGRCVDLDFGTTSSVPTWNSTPGAIEAYSTALDRMRDGIVLTAESLFFDKFDTDEYRTDVSRLVDLWIDTRILRGTRCWSVVPDRGLWKPDRADEAGSRSIEPSSRERIVVGPTVRQALDELAEQASAADA
jgi:hypothetical protein